MSLADQSQVWYPTSVQVTVHQARNLRIKGKNGSNDAYAIMQVAKDKFSTSVAEKCVAPVWKEEANFDLPLFHHGNVDRCTLYIIVNHRASVGLDKLLGQAVINLVELHEKKSRNKTEWFKLVDKNGKADKDRGEVLLDIQFMRNNMSASMFDLSMQDKPRSRIGKLKDKIRGKKKDGFSDSASAIVPSFSSQVLTDSEGEGEEAAPADSQGAKKKSKLKTLFAPKSNLTRNVSQSMSTLGTLPEKNSTLGGSRASGLNVDSPEPKKKFKFLTHKRTGSSDSKASQGPFSILSRSKPSAADPSLCINGSHVYAEEPEGQMSQSSSVLSLNSADHGSAEDLRRTHGRNDSDLSVDSIKGLNLPSYKPEVRDRTLLQRQPQQRKGQEEAEEQERRAEARRLQEDQERRAEAKRLQEERRLEGARLAEEEERLREEALKQEALRHQEEARRAEEQKQQEEVSVSDRLSSLFGIGRKKDEKKEEEKPKPAPPATVASVLPSSSNPFEEIPLSSDTLNPFVDHQQGVPSLQTPPSSGFPSRTPKVSAVKPSFSSNAPDMFSDMHNSMAPSQVRRNSADLLSSSDRNHASASPSTKRRALVPPNYMYQSPVSNANTPTPAQTETHNPLPRQPKATPRRLSTAASAKEEIGFTGDPGHRGTQKNKGPSLPLPDYETLYPKKIHGVHGQTKWDHIVAEVTQRQRDYPPELIGKEVNVDEPSSRQDLPSPTPRDRSALPGKTTGNLKQAESEEGPSSTWKRMGSGSKYSFTPPKRTTAASEKVQLGPSTRQVLPTVAKPNDLFASRVLGAKVQNRSVPQTKPRSVPQTMPRPVARDEKKVLNTSLNIDSDRDALPKESQWPPEKEGRNSISAGGAHENPDNRAKEIPSITPRRRPVIQKSGSVSQMESTAAVLRSAHEDPSTDAAVQGDSGKMEKLVNSNVISDPVAKFPEQDKTKENGAAEHTPGDQTASSAKKSRAPPPPVKLDNAGRAVDPFSRSSTSSPLPITSSLVSPVPLKAVAGDVGPQPGGTSGGKTPLRTSEETQAAVSTVLESSNMPKRDLFEKPSELFPSVEKVDDDPLPSEVILAVQGDSGKMEKLENSSAIRDRELLTSEETQAAVSTVLESSNMPKRDLFEKPSELFPSVEKVDDDPLPSEVILAVQGDSGKMEKLENSSAIRDRELLTSEETQAAVSTVLESSNMPKRDLFEKPSELFPSVEKVDDDSFPSEVIVAKDPWALPVQSFEGNDLFTGGPKGGVKHEEAGMTTDDMEKPFGQKDERKPFSYFDHSDPVAKFPEQDKTKENCAIKHTPGDQKPSSAKKSHAPLPPVKLDNAGGAVDPFSPSSTSSPLPITSSLVSPVPLKAVAVDVGPQPGGTSGRKTRLRTWVSPSEAQAVTLQSRSGGMAVGKGGEPASTPRRPHPVKPMSPLENHSPASISLARDIKLPVIRENVPEKMKVSSSVESGPYSQLTQDELVSLVVKQQDDLCKKNDKIVELEDYIDNLLVHVIEEKPSILLAMAKTKKAI